MSKHIKIRSKNIKGYTHQSLYCVYLFNCLLTQILQLLCKYNQCILAYRHSQNALLPKPSIRMGKRGDLWNLKMAWLLVQDRNFRNCWSTGVFPSNHHQGWQKSSKFKEIYSKWQFSWWKCLIDVGGQRRMAGLLRADRKESNNHSVQPRYEGQMGYRSRRQHWVPLLSTIYTSSPKLKTGKTLPGLGNILMIMSE